jgi:hypothetical protein
VKVVTNFYKANFDKTIPLMHHDVRVDRMHFNPETGASMPPAVHPPTKCPGPVIFSIEVVLFVFSESSEC